MARKKTVTDSAEFSTPPHKSESTAFDELHASYQKLLIEHEQLKQAYDAVIHATPDLRKLPQAGIPTETFKVNGNTYQMAAASINIAGIGKRTALECMVDDTIYPCLKDKTILQWMVQNNSTAVKKIS